MKQKHAKQWIKALRSGKYKQIEHYLCTVEGKTSKYDVLGLLCHINNLDYIREKWYKKYRYKNYYGTTALPLAFCRKLGMKNPYGFFEDENGDRIYLAGLNDQKVSFKKLADIIEKYWEKI